MANIVELREESAEKLESMLEEARKEMFNLRFQRASGQLEDYSRMKAVQREVAQLETVLHMRHLAIDAASAVPEIKSSLNGKEWDAFARFVYESSEWQVDFTDDKGNSLASANVDLNKKQPKSKRDAIQKGQPQLVTSYEVTG